MHIQPFGYFGLQGIVNGNQLLPHPLALSYLTHLAGGSEIEIQNFYDRVRTDI